MHKQEKQLKYSIRKVSVGTASVVIGALYLLMGAGIAHADVDQNSGAHTTSTPSEQDQSAFDSPVVTGSVYPAATVLNPMQDKNDAIISPRTEKATSTKNGETSSEAGYSVPPTSSRRVRREAPGTNEAGTGTESEPTPVTGDASPTENDNKNEALDDARRKGSKVSDDQPGIIVPKGDQKGADDPQANLTFDAPSEDATVEYMYKIIQNIPDSIQNNERSYLRNMNTLGDALHLQPGEIKELHEFGGWHAIDNGKFVIGRKNVQGYFTGWHMKEDGMIEQGGMLGADALDNIYVHEQALDRRFNYMLMLVKGRTRANREETVVDHSEYNPKTENERVNLTPEEFKKLPFLEKDKLRKYSPGVVGYNGIEKNFAAFSTKYGSRVRVEFVTGYISDINGSKGSYRVVIKTQNSQGQENTVYDETIHRVAEIVQNEELYKKGLDVQSAHNQILKLFKDEFNYRVIQIRNAKVKANPLLGRTKEKDYTPEQRKVYDQIVEEAKEEVKKQGDIVMNVGEDFLSIEKSKKKDSEWKKAFTNTSKSPISLANDLNNLLKNADKDNPNTPTWQKSGTPQAKADDRAYKLLKTLIPGAKKITYHVNDDQLEVETDKYTYIAARNGSKEVGIQGSDIVATDSAASYGFTPDKFAIINSNTTVNNNYRGWARANDEGFQNFSKLIGADHGINRTNVLTDEELSDKIIEKLGPGNSKLGKAGYFSTADIPLGKGIVSYTVQVIPADNDRVGANPQSHRIQYNMPILADFSVLQYTVDPSIVVAKRIIDKQIKEKKIPLEEGEKIKGKIDKSKKTSEVRKAISGNVKVKYVDTNGTVLTLNNTVASQSESVLGEKAEDGTYFDKKDQVIGADYDVTAKKLETLTTTDGKRYRVRRSVNDGLAADSAAAVGNVSSEERTVTYVYEESTMSSVTANHYKEGTTEKLADSVIQPDLTRGTEYTTTSETIPEKIEIEEKEDRVITRKKTYTLVKTPDNATGTVTNSDVTVNYYYTENVTVTEVKKQATVVANYYKDGTTEKLADSVDQGQKDIGSAYTTEAKDIPAKTVVQDLPDKTVTTTTTYTLKEVPADQNGVVPVGGKEVNYYYTENVTVNEVKKQATVVANYYKDSTTEKLADSVDQGKKDIGSTYTTEAKDIPAKTLVQDLPHKTVTTTTTYTLKEVPADQNGVVPVGGKEVNYYYTENVTVNEVKKQATVVANYYKDSTTEKLADSVDQGKKDIGSAYTTEAKVIPAKTVVQDLPDKTVTTTTTYTLKEVPADQNGVVPVGGKEVNYYYTENVTVNEVKKQATVVANYYKDGTTEKLADSVDQGKKDIGSAYTTEAKDIPAKTLVQDLPDKTVTTTTTYTLKEVPADQNGVVPVGGKEVNYYYRENVEETVVLKKEKSTETKTITRTIHYVDKVTNHKLKEDVVQPITLIREKTVNKVTGAITYTEWTTGNWSEVVSPEIANYGKPDLPKVSNEEVTADSKDTTILVRYDRLSTPDKPTPEKPKRPNPQEPGTPYVSTPLLTPENPSVPTPRPEIPNQEIPISQSTPEPHTPTPETPASSDSEVPTSETGKREELPNTGMEDNASLAGAGLLTLLAGLGLGFFKKKENGE